MNLEKESGEAKMRDTLAWCEHGMRDGEKYRRKIKTVGSAGNMQSEVHMRERERGT